MAGSACHRAHCTPSLSLRHRAATAKAQDDVRMLLEWGGGPRPMRRPFRRAWQMRCARHSWTLDATRARTTWGARYLCDGRTMRRCGGSAPGRPG
eukprot:1029434-Rhodomonas_salina.2